MKLSELNLIEARKPKRLGSTAEMLGLEGIKGVEHLGRTHDGKQMMVVINEEGKAEYMTLDKDGHLGALGGE